MKCLVIGGSGFIGSFLIKKLISEKNEVVNFDLQDSNISEVNTIIGDINNREDLEDIKSDFDIVYILAAVHKDDVSDYTEYYRTNCNGLDNIINFFKRNKIDRIVYFSSAAVYGDTFIDASEEQNLTPESHYGKSKVKAEKKLIYLASKYKKELKIIRPSVVFGSGSKSNMNRLINYISQNKFFIVGKGNNLKSICYVENLVDFTIYISKKTVSNIDIFNYLDYPNYSIREICDKISFISNSGKVKNIPYLVAYLGVFVIQSFYFIISRKATINMNRIKKSMSNTSLSYKKLDSLNFKSRYNLNDSIYKTLNR